MSTILSSLNAHNFPIFQAILKKLLSKSMIHRVLSYKAYLSLGLRSPLRSTGTVPAAPTNPRDNMMKTHILCDFTM